LDASTGELQPELAKNHLGRDIVMLCGPSFADEVAAGKPCCLVAASHHQGMAQTIAQLFLSSPVRVYTGDDPIAVAVASSVKNVIAIAAGITAALDLGGQCQSRADYPWAGRNKPVGACTGRPAGNFVRAGRCW
jgi:glycerol-3-phosphate dehydrogenase